MNGAQRQLIDSCQAGDVKGVENAVKTGAQVDQLTKEGEDAGRAALHLAAAAGHLPIVKLLLNYTDNINIRSGRTGDDGGTPLHLAAEAGHPHVIKFLITNGAHREAQDNRGRTAVHWAALRGQVSALQQLFDKSCDIHARVDGKSNALHFGAASGELEAVEWLVQAGVNKNQKDKDNKTPSDIAKKKGFKDISAFLKDKNSTKSSDVRQGESMKKKNPDFSRLEDQLNRLESEKGTYAEDLERKNSEISKFQEQLRRLEYEKRHLEDVLREMELNPRPRQLDVSLSETQHQLQIITLQNKEYKKILHQQQAAEAELLKKNIAMKQTIDAMGKEIQRMSIELRKSEEKFSQQQQMEETASTRIAALKKEVDYLTHMLSETGSRAINTQDILDRKIAALMKEDETNRSIIADLNGKLREAERNLHSQVQLIEKERHLSEQKAEDQQTISILTQEVGRLLQRVAAQAHSHTTTQELESRVRLLLEQDDNNKHTIDALRQQISQMSQQDDNNKHTIDALRQQISQMSQMFSERDQKTTINQNVHHRTVNELLEQGKLKQETIKGLENKIEEMRETLSEYEQRISSYQIRLENKEKKVKESEAESEATIRHLREEVDQLTRKLDTIHRKVYDARVRHASTVNVQTGSLS